MSLAIPLAEGDHGLVPYGTTGRMANCPVCGGGDSG